MEIKRHNRIDRVNLDEKTAGINTGLRKKHIVLDTRLYFFNKSTVLNDGFCLLPLFYSIINGILLQPYLVILMVIIFLLKRVMV